jgi:hypothetical protein
MKNFIYAAFAALFVCCAMSCQKNSSTSSKLNGDTVLAKYTVNYYNAANNEQFPIRYNYWTTGKEISKISWEPGDTLFDFVHNDKGDLVSFKYESVTVHGAITDVASYVLSYSKDTITLVETSQSFDNGYSGVTTRILTMKDSLITSLKEIDDSQLREKTDYFYDEFGNVTKEVQNVAGQTITYTYFPQYKNPLMIGQCRLINCLFGGGFYMSPNYVASETDRPTSTNDPSYATVQTYTVNEHWGSFPTKVHSVCNTVTFDYTYEYSIK